MSTLELNAKKTALILIDLQNGIVARDVQPHSAEQVVERSVRLAKTFRASGAPVIYVRVDLAKILTPLSDQPSGIPPNPPAALSEIAASAEFQSGDYLVTKNHWGAFAQTDLEAILKKHNVDTVVLAGIATNIGVESTARQGVGLGFSFVLVEDACATFSEAMHRFAFEHIFPRISRVRSTDEVIAAIA